MREGLPDGWINIALPQVAELIMGQSPPSTTYNTIGNGLPFFQGKAEFSDMYPSPEKYCDSPGKIAESGDVLISVRAPVGPTNLCQIQSCIGRGLAVIRPKGEVPSKYLLYFFRNIEPWLSQQGTGSTFTAISKGDLQEIELPLAPLPEQRRIVAKLEALLAKVDTSRKRLERIPVILKRFRQAILAAACEGRLTEDWRLVHPDGSASSELDRILSTRLESAPSSIARERLKGFHRDSQTLPGSENVLPESWIACCVGHVGNVVNGSTPSRKCPDYWAGDIPWVSSGEVQNGTITTTRESITREGFENASVSLLPRGTVLIAMIGEGKTRCQTALLDVDACINQNIAGVVMDHGLVDSRFLWYWFKARYEQNRTVGSGSGPQALNCQRVRELPLNLPPLEEQREITRRMDQMMALADQIEARYIKAKTHVDRLTQSILAKAFRGELVPQDPNDEPAEMQLARLKTQPADAPSAKRRGRPKKAGG